MGSRDDSGSLGTPRPHGLHYPDDPDVFAEEPSQVTDMPGMFRKTEKMSRMLVRMEAPIARIPAIEEKLDDAVERVTRVEEKTAGNTSKVSALERRVSDSSKPHDCSHDSTLKELRIDSKSTASRLEQGARVGVEHSTKLEGLEKTVSGVESDIEDIKQSPKRVVLGMASIIVTLLTMAGGAVWFLAELNKDVEFERTQRAAIQEQIKTMAKRADHGPVLKRLESLEKGMNITQEWEEGYNQLCNGMTRQERRFMKNMLRRRGKAVPDSCLE
jgi:hypothetical protein